MSFDFDDCCRSVTTSFSFLKRHPLLVDIAGNGFSFLFNHHHYILQCILLNLAYHLDYLAQLCALVTEVPLLVHGYSHMVTTSPF